MAYSPPKISIPKISAPVAQTPGLDYSSPYQATNASQEYASGNIWTDPSAGRTRYNASDVINNLRGFGQDYGSAANYLENLYRTTYNTDLGAAESIQNAARNYFSGWNVDPTEDTYDQYKRRQQLMSVRDWDPNVMFTGELGGYAGRANALMLQNYQKMQAGSRATRFAENLDNYIAGETSSLQQSLQAQMDQKRKGMLAEMNRRGLLMSGQRGLQEANIASDTASEFEKGRADIYKGAQEKAQQLFTDPALKNSQYEGQLQDVKNRLQQMRDSQKDARSQLFGSAAGLIGQGIGNYYGSKSSTPSTSSTGYGTQAGNVKNVANTGNTVLG